ncbi:MAG: hypothetical protein GF405_00255 [Candidatus Eisenbacteria bacterium]|nr:hypothetical protein [Candidatus Eisenbacteria bacterium]
MARTAIAVLLTVGLVSTALANPILGEWFYVDFDPPNYQHTIEPAPYTPAEGYLVLNLEYAWPQDATAVSFRVDIVPWPDAEPAFEALQPFSITEGTWREGVTLSLGECLDLSQPTPVARFSFMYAGGAHDVFILDHPDYPRWLLDCSDPPELRMYCVYANGAVGKPDYIGGDCAGNPVERSSWGTIKTMYR